MNKKDWFILLLILSTFGVGIYLYPQLPDQIPMHWNLKGEVDDYGSKFFGTFMLPILNLGMFLLFKLMPYIDPRKENYTKFKGTYQIFRYIMHIFLVIMFFEILLQSLYTPEEIPSYLEVSFVIPLFVSILIIITGNYMGKVKDNFFFGFRTPWTLSSKEVWYKTHRLGSKLYVVSGILGIIGVFLPDMITFILLIGPVILSSIFVTIYSYFLYQKEQRS